MKRVTQSFSCLIVGLLLLYPATALSQCPGTKQPESLYKYVDSEKVPQSDKEKKKPDNYSMMCHIYNFDLFFALFSEDAAFQMYASISPLRITTHDANPEFAPPGNEIPVITVRYLYPPTEPKAFRGYFDNRQKRFPRCFYSVKYDQKFGNIVSVVLNRESSGILTEYVFKWDGCWFLSEIIDRST